MARGWESKSVEEQVAEKESGAGKREELSDVEKTRRMERAAVEMKLAKLRGDLARATNPRHREMLEKGIEELERGLK